VLRSFAENVFHVGAPGAGHTIKLLNNFIAQAICTATAEAFAVGARAGVDLKQLVSLISVGAVNSGIFQMMSKTLDGDLGALRFELDNARKDIRYYTHLPKAWRSPR
jgi:3-hydroxyisobutyrate dehydrogenase-like beta-hydroxyacid dehydrogenase